jgi:hypothetical protein
VLTSGAPLELGKVLKRWHKSQRYKGDPEGWANVWRAAGAGKADLSAAAKNEIQTHATVSERWHKSQRYMRQGCWDQTGLAVICRAVAGESRIREESTSTLKNRTERHLAPCGLGRRLQ